MKQDVIFIRELSLQVIIGVYPKERLKKQPIILDLDLFVDNRTAALSDNILDAVDYDALTGKIRDFVEDTQFQLIETLAEQIAHFILKNLDIAKVRLTLQKPNALSAAKTVGVMIERDGCE